ncbi:CTD small phosphatase-like protein 2 [Trichinella britovi]|uniref:CTD small phosphatase-like protein 2 n=1 Tax=Trichinella britovi TaxID=45882 RepID=A0A0V1CXY2_TRIBR|nr:CTD small phosphatase-like protein 2 [Trichinella britovi]
MFILNNPIIAQSDIIGSFIGHCAIVGRFVLLDITFGYPLRTLGNGIFCHFAHFCHAETFVLHNSHFPFTDFICLFFLFWKLKTIKMNSNQDDHSGKKVFKRKKDNSSFNMSWFTPLPTIPEKSKKLYTAVLDLDHTLVHSLSKRIGDPRYKIINIPQATRRFYTAVRPCCAEFLESISEYYEVMLFTAGTTRYANAVIDQLIDPEHKYFSYSYCRPDCAQVDHEFVKDLSILGRDLSKTVIMDDNMMSFCCHIDNGILVEPWDGDAKDRELKTMMRIFHEIVDSNVEDVRPFLRERFQLYKIFED